MDRSQQKVARLKKMHEACETEEGRAAPTFGGYLLLSLGACSAIVAVAATIVLLSSRNWNRDATFARNSLPEQAPVVPQSAPAGRLGNDGPTNDAGRLDKLLIVVSKALNTRAESDARAAKLAIEQDRARLGRLVPQLKERAVRVPAAAAALLLLDTYAICDLPEAAAILAAQLQSPINEVR